MHANNFLSLNTFIFPLIALFIVTELKQSGISDEKQKVPLKDYIKIYLINH